MAKTKKEIILELKQANPNLTPEDAAAQVPCTLAYAKRILAAETAVLESEISSIGKEIGIPQHQLKEWHDWVVQSLKAESAKKVFNSHLLRKQMTLR